MNEYLSVYLVDFQKGMACSVHKKRAGVYVVKNAAGIGKAIGGVGAAIAAALGINAWPKIEKIMPSYAASGAVGGGLVGAGMGMMKDSDVPKLDPNALAVMSDQQKDVARSEHSKQRRGEMIRRGLLGALKGAVGGATLGAVGATGKGVYEQIQEEGAGALEPTKAIRTILDWLDRQKQKAGT